MASSDETDEVSGLDSGLRATGSGSRGARHNRAVGRFGEDVAARFLEARGVRILGRNVRVGRGEIDLHAEVAGASVAVEVKTILASRPGDDAVVQFTPEKARTLRRYARHLAPPAYRVDLVTVTAREETVDVRWLPNSG